MAFNLNESPEENTIRIGNIIKLISIIVILAITLFFGFYPLFSKITKRSTRFLGHFNSFSGGVFIGIGLFLLLPQSKEVIEEWSKENISDERLKEGPYCFFISFGAYSILLLIEKVVFNSQSLIPMISGEGGHSHGHAHGDESHDHSHEEINKGQRRDSHVSGEPQVEDEDSDEDEEAFKNVVSAKGKFASFLGMRNRKNKI